MKLLPYQGIAVAKLLEQKPNKPIQWDLSGQRVRNRLFSWRNDT
jgi:hypothetical protein